MKSIIFGTRIECVNTNTESLQVVDRLQSTDFLVFYDAEHHVCFVSMEKIRNCKD